MSISNVIEEMKLNENYLLIRRDLVKGKISLNTAKELLKKEGAFARVYNEMTIRESWKSPSSFERALSKEMQIMEEEEDKCPI